MELGLEKLEKAIEIEPDSPSNYLNRGIFYYLHNQWLLALEDFNRAIEINPSDAIAYCNRG